VEDLGELCLVEIVLECQRLEVRLADRAALVGVIDELRQKIVLQRVQWSLRSFLS
jgi:hypothetical protein